MLKYTMPTGTTLSYTQIADRSIRVIQNDSVTVDKKEHLRTEFTQQCVFSASDSLYRISQKEFWYCPKKDSTQGDTLFWEQTILLSVQPNGRLVELVPSSSDDKTSATYAKNMLEQGTPVFPSERLRVGSKWSQSTSVVFPSDTLEASTTFRVVRVDMEGNYRCAVVEYSGNLILPIEVNPSDSLSRTGVDFVTSKGETWYAIDGGYPVKTVEQWIIKGDRKKTVKGEVIPYKIEVESNLTMKLNSMTSPPIALR